LSDVFAVYDFGSENTLFSGIAVSAASFSGRREKKKEAGCHKIFKKIGNTE
jgi:hypothetical protein